MVIFAPMADNNYIQPRVKKSITIRPLPESGIREYGKEITAHDWREVLSEKNIDCKVNIECINVGWWVWKYSYFIE